MFNPEKNSFQKMQRRLIWIFKMRIKFCPKCGDTDLIMVAGAEIGVWRCKICNFESSIFPEKEIGQEVLKESKKKK